METIVGSVRATHKEVVVEDGDEGALGEAVEGAGVGEVGQRELLQQGTAPRLAAVLQQQLPPRAAVQAARDAVHRSAKQALRRATSAA